ncbi:MAG: PilZ domain-containing protein [Desulfobacterales bacterium]
MKERKPRIALEVGFEVKLLNDDHRFRAEILDISEGGIKFKEANSGLLDKIKIGDMLFFLTDIDFYGIRGKGEVKWISKDRESAGVCFMELDEKSQTLLDEFMRIVV